MWKMNETNFKIVQILVFRVEEKGQIGLNCAKSLSFGSNPIITVMDEMRSTTPWIVEIVPFICIL